VNLVSLARDDELEGDDEEAPVDAFCRRPIPRDPPSPKSTTKSESTKKN